MSQPRRSPESQASTPTMPAEETSPLALICENLVVSLERREVLRGVNLSVATGEWVALIGPNGAGKTTLLHAIAGIHRFHGRVLIAGEDAAAMRPRRRARLVSLVPQNPVMPAGVSALAYVLLGRTPHRGFSLGVTGEDHESATRALKSLDLTEISERPINKLSGGERQRVITARALAQEAPLMLLDEPIASLDVGRQLEVLELVDDLRRQRNLTVLCALHDLNLAAQFADRLLLLAEGRFVAGGTPPEVLSAPEIARYYGSDVELITDERGSVVVIRREPRR